MCNNIILTAAEAAVEAAVDNRSAVITLVGQRYIALQNSIEAEIASYAAEIGASAECLWTTDGAGALQLEVSIDLNSVEAIADVDYAAADRAQYRVELVESIYCLSAELIAEVSSDNYYTTRHAVDVELMDLNPTQTADVAAELVELVETHSADYDKSPDYVEAVEDLKWAANSIVRALDAIATAAVYGVIELEGLSAVETSTAAEYDAAETAAALMPAAEHGSSHQLLYVDSRVALYYNGGATYNLWAVDVEGAYSIPVDCATYYNGSGSIDIIAEIIEGYYREQL